MFVGIKGKTTSEKNQHNKTIERSGPAPHLFQSGSAVFLVLRVCDVLVHDRRLKHEPPQKPPGLYPFASEGSKETKSVEEEKQPKTIRTFEFAVSFSFCFGA